MKGSVEGIEIKVVEASCAEGNTEHLGKVRLHALVGNELKHRHINGIGFNAAAVLHRPGQPSGEFGDKAFALLVHQDLRVVFGDVGADADIKALPGFKARFPVVTSRQCSPIDLDDFGLLIYR